ncbi:FAD-binding oxidoreductase [Spirillospora sp. NPDC052269]
MAESGSAGRAGAVPGVLVIGNGVLGLSIAWEVARRAPDCPVTVVGPPERPGAASAAAGAMLNCFGEVTAQTFDHPAGRAKFDIARRALDAWPGWLECLRQDADEPGLGQDAPQGTFVVLGAKAADQTIANYEAILAVLRAFDEPHQEVAPSDITGLAPEVNARPVRALHLPREGALDARATLHALEKALDRRGVARVPQSAEGLHIVGERVRGVRLADGTLMNADAVVLAAGSLSQAFIQELPPGLVPPMLHGAGLAVQTRRELFPGFAEVVRSPNQAGACGLHLVPLTGDGDEYIGATNVLSFHPIAGPRMGVSYNLLRSACEQLDRRLGNSSVRRWLFGRRPVTLDGLPLLGAAPSCGLIFATGTYRDGFHSSPLIARHITDVILRPDQAAAKPWEHLAPERAPIEQTTVAESIERFVAHEIDAAVILGIQLPYCVDPEALTRQSRQRATELLERLEEPVALLPEVLNALNNEPDAGSTLLRPYLRHARAHYRSSAGPTTRPSPQRTPPGPPSSPPNAVKR